MEELVKLFYKTGNNEQATKMQKIMNSIMYKKELILLFCSLFFILLHQYCLIFKLKPENGGKMSTIW